MASPITIVGFLEDTYLHPKHNVHVSSASDSGLGKLDSLLIDYFSTKVYVTDPRSNRLNILPQNTVGQMKLHFDAKFVSESGIWDKITTVTYMKIFNMFETIMYMQGASQLSLSNYLMSSIDTKDVFVENSLILSSTKANITVEGTLDITIPKWFQVNATFTGTDGITYEVLFKIFVDSKTFAQEYPYTTITKVIPPVDPAFLFGGTSYSNIMDAVIGSNVYINKRLDESIRLTDQTGAHLVYLKYVVNSTTAYTLPFQILHKGSKRPSATACRMAIKDFLLSLNLVTENKLKEIFPELFLLSTFYLIPLWDLVVPRLDRTIEPAFTPSLSSIYTKVKNVVDIDPNRFLSTGCIMMNGQNDLFTFAYPDPLNVDKRGLKELFPTFTSHASHEVEFNYMDKQDQELARWVNTCFGVLNKTLTSDLYIPVTIDERNYLNFSCGFTEFFMLTKESYIKYQV